MAYAVYLFPKDDTIWTDAWEKFESEVWFKSSDPNLNNLLKQWKCRVVPNDLGYIEFESEKDALFFLLKWS